MWRTVFAGTLGLGFCAGLAWGAEYVLETEISDTTIYEESQNAGGGIDGVFSGTILTGQRRRALIKADLSAIPATETVESVTLELTVDRSGGGVGGIEYTLHRVEKDWGEGTATANNAGGRGGPAGAGDATWVSNQHGSATWTAPGGDFAATASAAATTGGAGSTTTWSGPGLLADVQFFLDNPGQNFGWILISTIEGTNQRVQKFDSSEASVTTVPRLTITTVEEGFDLDIDGNGFVDAVDIQLVINGSLGIDISPFDADVNGDLEVNAVDIQLVINGVLAG